MNPAFRFVQQYSLAALLLAAAATAQAQTGGVRLGTAGTPDPSAVLDLRPDVATTPKGFLPPRLNAGQRDAISSPAPGLTVFNTTTNQLNVWDGIQWVAYLADTSGQGPVTFAYTGAAQTYTVPSGVTILKVDMAGAAGGSSYYVNNSQGLGGRVQATLAVIPGQVLTIYVGGAGAPDTGGYNGGGGAYGGDGGGGGASDLRQGGTALANRVLVAGGGGGGGDYTAGGCGGGLTACTSSSFISYTGGGGGSQTGPGAGGTGLFTGNPGVSNVGGAGNGVGGGGGGGYFGGGGGDGTGGGGGSSFAGAGTSGVVHTQGTQTGNGYVLLTPLPDNIPAPVLNASNFTNLPAPPSLSLSGQNLSISGGNTVALPAAQTLSVSGQNLSISGGNTVAVPGDNLGNHTATQPLGFTTNDADKIYFTQAAGANGSKLAHGAGWNLDYYAGPNTGLAGTHRFFTGTATGWQERLRIDASGSVGIGTTAPYSQLANTSSNILGAEGTGGNNYSLAWQANQPGYAAMVYNGGYSTSTNCNGLAVKVGYTTGVALDVSQAASATTPGTSLLRVLSNGNVSVGALTPAAKLDVAGTVKLGTAGSVLTNIIKATVTYDVGNITANVTRVESLTVAGARPGATVFVSPSTGFTNAVIAWARVSANDTVEIGFTTAITTDPASKDYYITVIQ